MTREFARTRLIPVVVAALVSAAAAAALATSGALSGAEESTVATRFHVRPSQPVRGIAVVAVDDTTFSDLGMHWPFRRSVHAEVVRRLHAAGARAIVYDVQFTEPTVEREDLALYDALGEAGGAIMATTETNDHGGTDVLGGDANLARVRSRAAASVLPVGRGGVLSRVPARLDGLDTLAYATAERVHRAPPRSAFPSAGARIDFAGPPGTVPTYSFSDVYNGRVPASDLRGRIVVVGAASPALQDVHPTPTDDSQLMSGPEVQANAILTALHGIPLRDAGATAALLIALLLALAAPIARLRLRVVSTVLVALALAAAYAAFAQLAFDAGTVVPVAVPLASLAIGTIAAIVASHLAETAERRRVAGQNTRLEHAVRERTADLRETQLEMVERLANAAESRDGETGRHIARIGHFCFELALEVGMPAEEAELLRHASAMHDVGKIGVPDRVLLKPGRFSPEERAVMETHTKIGASILAGSSAPLLRLAEEVALTHHERWDGSGYPNGLSGEEIPLAGRICAICDVFDALLSSRPYKRAWTLAEALTEIREQRGRHFDPDLVDAFLRIAPRLHAELAPLHTEPVIREVA
jgi:response regulator RpfG family c-di-GMP phosphodiesterase